MALLARGLARGRIPLAAAGVGGFGAGVAAVRWHHVSAVRCEEAARKPQGVKAEKDEKDSAWLSFSLPSLPDLPTFSDVTSTFASLRKSFESLHSEVTRDPDSRYAKVVASAKDPKVHEELNFDATVRLSPGLSHSERAFVRNRRDGMRKSFAKLIGVEVDEIDVRDIPVVSVAGSGGGYRAMVNTLGSVKAMEEMGLWDCVMYASAVSGSCWALNVMYAVGDGNVDKTIAHIKNRIQTPFLDPSTLELLVDNKTSEYLLSGAILKAESEGADLSLVDIYGTLVSARLYVPSDPKHLLPSHLKISSQRLLVDDGSNPLPIYCMIRHEVPAAAEDAASDVAKDQGKKGKEKEKAEEDEKEKLSKSRWMWAELSPYEMGFEELGAWIPTWSVGRRFENGKNVERLPELSLTIFSGIFASAFCATLYSYFKEVRPLLRPLPYFKQLEEWLVSNYETSLDSIHPFPPAELPNFLHGLEGKLPEGAPEGLTKLETLGFMDAGANLNIPYIPLFRRDCDLIIALDASADSQDLWFSRAAEYASSRQIRTWPRIAFPALAALSSPGESPSPGAAAASKVDQAKAQEQAVHYEHADPGSEAQPTSSNPHRVPEGSAPHSANSDPSERSPKSQQLGEQKAMPTSDGEEEKELGRCNIWIGSSEDDGEGSCRNDDPTVEDVMARDGIVLAYYPLKGGPEMEDPTEIWSTWKFEYKEEETQQLVNLAQANFISGEKQLITTLKGLWMRKRQQRLAEEGNSA